MNEETEISRSEIKYRKRTWSIFTESKLTVPHLYFLKKCPTTTHCFTMQKMRFSKDSYAMSSPRCIATLSHISPFIVCEGHPACRQFN